MGLINDAYPPKDEQVSPDKEQSTNSPVENTPTDSPELNYIHPEGGVWNLDAPPTQNEPSLQEQMVKDIEWLKERSIVQHKQIKDLETKVDLLRFKSH